MTDDPIDFSSLDPARDITAWERRVLETVEQGELLRGLDLSPLDLDASPDGAASKTDAAVRRILDATPESVVVTLAPRALAAAALLAAASWLLVWVDNGQPQPTADPALAVMSWASGGEPLSLEQMNAATGRVVGDGR